MKLFFTNLFCLFSLSSFLFAQTIITDPPNTNVRSMAEWEELQAIVIAWDDIDYDLLTEITRHAKKECEVIILTENEFSTKNYLASKGVDWSENVRFVVDDLNTVWIRDYGANPIYINDVDSLALVDWIYNRPRPDDDDSAGSIATTLNIPLYRTLEAPYDLVHTGGNFMSDGLGLGFSSELVLDENDANSIYGVSNHDEAAIDDLMQQYMGIEEYVKLPNLPYDGIHHIDMHMKLLDETTLLVGKYPEGIADGPQIEANIAYMLSNVKTAYGKPFEIIRIPMPPESINNNKVYPNQNGDYLTYANALFVNKTVLVPNYYEEYDSIGMRIWEESLPGYNIVGLDCNDIIRYSGAIHCITKEIGVADPLWIAHERLRDQEDQGEAHEVLATIKHRTGISEANVWFSTDLDLGMQMLPMELIDASEDLWRAFIPNQSANAGDVATIHYYIEATANSGKQISRPLPAPAATFDFKVNYPTSNEEISINTVFEPIFPNPASAITCIPVQSERNTTGEIVIKDILGRKLTLVHEGAIPSGASKYFFNAQEFSSGTYIVELRTKEQLISQKVLIK